MCVRVQGFDLAFGCERIFGAVRVDSVTKSCCCKYDLYWILCIDKNRKLGRLLD